MSENPANQSNDQSSDQLDAAVLRRLLEHLDERKDVQNIDLMNPVSYTHLTLPTIYSV